MPFELGIDYGSRKFAENHFGEKKFLVIAKERFDYAKALSDLAGVDIKTHNDDVEELIRSVRNWFSNTVGLKNLKPGRVIFNDFIDFMADFDAERRSEGFNDADIYNMPTPEFAEFIDEWIQRKTAP